MRRAAASIALLLVLAPCPPCRAGVHRVLVAPVRLEGDAAGPSARDWRDAVARRLSERFDVVSPEAIPEDVPSSLAIARAARLDYAVEVRYTRLGGSSTLDLTMRDLSGKTVGTVSVDAVPVNGRGEGAQGDLARLSIAATARLVRLVLGESPRGGPSAGKGGGGTPAGVLERSAPVAGRVDGAALAVLDGSGEAGWFIASGGAVRLFPLKGAETQPPVDVLPVPGVAPPVHLAPGDLDGDGKAEVAVGKGGAGGGTFVLLRPRRGGWVPSGGETAGTPLRVAGSGRSAVLLATVPGKDSPRPATFRYGPEGAAPERTERAVAGVPGAPGVLAFLPGGTLVAVSVDGQGRIRAGTDGGGGVDGPAPSPAGFGRVLLVPVDPDGDGAEGLLAVAERVRPGAFFGNLSVPSGSDILYYSLSPGAPPRLEWRLLVPDTGIVAAGADRSGGYYFLRQEEAPAGDGAAWRSLRMR